MRRFLALILCVLMLCACTADCFADGGDVLEPSEGGTYFTIQFIMYDAMGENRTVLQQSQVPYGVTPEYSGSTPSCTVPKEYEAVFERYEFVGWDPEIGPAAEETEYTAQFEPVEKLYTVQYIDGNGAVLQSDQLSFESYIMLYHGTTPTKKSTAEFDYEFTGWDPEPQEEMLVEYGRTFQAKFKENRRSYTITWNDDKGKEIGTSTVEYGTVPTHADITKQDTAEFTYTFAGWDPTPTAVTEAAVYTAVFDSTKRSYYVTVENGTGSGNYAVGSSVTIQANTPKTGKRFNAWTGADGLNFTSGTTKTATATFTMPAHAVTLTANYNTAQASLTLISNCDEVQNKTYRNITFLTLPALERSGYIFLGWSRSRDGNVNYREGDRIAVNEDVTLFAKWAKVYTIRWLDDLGGNCYDITYVQEGTIPIPPSSTSDISIYVLKGWYPELTAATKDTIYSAVWDKDHTVSGIIFSNSNNSGLENSQTGTTGPQQGTDAIAEKAESKQDILAKAEKGEAKTSKTIETVEAEDDDGEGALVCLGELTPSVTDEMKADFSTLADMLITASAKPSNFDGLINYFVQVEGCAMSASEPCRVVASTYPVTVTISLDNPEDFVGIMTYQYDKYSNPPSRSNETTIDVTVNDDGTVTFVLYRPSVLCFVYKIIEGPAPQGSTDTAGPVSGQESPPAPTAEGENSPDSPSENGVSSGLNPVMILTEMSENQRAVFISAIKTAMNTATLKNQAAKAADDFDWFINQVIMEIGPDAATASTAAIKKAATKVLNNAQFSSNGSGSILTVTKAAGGKYNITYNGSLAPQENTSVKGVETTDNTSASRSEIGPGTPSVAFYINGVQSNNVVVTMSSDPVTEAIFKSNTPAGWNCSNSYALSVNGKNDNTFKDGTLCMEIPSQLQKAGRQFMIIFADNNGKTFVINDMDNDPTTITINLAIEGYRFSLCYKD